MNACLNCGKPVKNKYCNTHCQNSYKIVINKAKYYLNPCLCKYCNGIIEYKYRMNKFCSNSCSAIVSNRTRKIEKVIKIKNKVLKTSNNLIKSQNKGKIFKLSKNWQSARSAIRRNACLVFKNSKKEYKCFICGYSHHVEIAHIRPVSDFNAESELSEINNINNLIALCPNHHWEFDHGVINL